MVVTEPDRVVEAVPLRTLAEAHQAVQVLMEEMVDLVSGTEQVEAEEPVETDLTLQNTTMAVMAAADFLLGLVNLAGAEVEAVRVKAVSLPKVKVVPAEVEMAESVINLYNREPHTPEAVVAVAEVLVVLE
jgi:hypothetical protein